MRHKSSITSLSWIPSEAIEGSMRLAFDAGFTHYDPPPPDVIASIEGLRATDRFRFANVLEAWVEVNDAGRIVDCGYSGGGMMGTTTISVGPGSGRSRRSRFPTCARPRRAATVRALCARRPAATGAARAAPRPPPAVHAMAVPRSSGPRSQLTIHVDGSADGGDRRPQPLSPPLDLRQPRSTLGEVGVGRV